MTAIEFENISKQYRLGLVSTRTLSHDIDRWWKVNVLHREDPYLKIGEVNDRSTKGNSDYVWALKDINFKVEQGDVVGIIGKNGAGKSTLLKLLSRVTAPTTGTIKARGRIASLLEVGTGFHSEMTGRENIYLNGAILGMTKQEITRKLDEIVDFSGCERYLDTPVKRYSSGMMVRLGFAVAAHLDPEILVVDEVLAVGDAEFQKKAIGKMNDISKGEGRTVLFVSHNMASVQTLCHTGILLDKGLVKCKGDVASVIDYYLKSTTKSIEEALHKRKDRKGSGKAHFVSIVVESLDNGTEILLLGGATKVVYSIFSEEELNDVCLITSFYNCRGTFVFCTNTRMMSKDHINLHKGENKIVCEFREFPLVPGSYRLNVKIEDNKGRVLDLVENAREFEIRERNIYGSAIFYNDSNSMIMLKQEWKTLM